MDEVVCKRCKKKTNKKYMIQTIIYLGKASERMNLCPGCFDSFREWFDEIEDQKDG